MAISVVLKNDVIEVSGFGKSDSDLDIFAQLSDGLADLKPGLSVNSITVFPGSSDDTFSLKEGSTTGPHLLYLTCEKIDDQKIEYFYGQRIRPWIDISECSFAASSSSRIIIKLK